MNRNGCRACGDRCEPCGFDDGRGLFVGLRVGQDENDFELTVDKLIPQGAFVYLEESECGGIVDALRDQLERGDSHAHVFGAHVAWHVGKQDSRPGFGAGLPHRVRQRLHHTWCVVVPCLAHPVVQSGRSPSGDVSIKSYQFERYVDAYTGVCAMAKANGLKLKVAYRSGHVETWLETAGDYGTTSTPTC